MNCAAIGRCVLLWILLSLVSRMASAQEVSLPDPGLNAAVRDALQKPNGPLTQADLLSLNFLGACCRNISNLEGLEAARNLTILDLHANSITNGAVIGSLAKLRIIDLFQNQLTTFVLPSALSNLAIVDLGFNSLTQCSLPAGLTNLDTLFLEGNRLTSFTLPTDLRNLTQLDLSGNSLGNVAFPPGLTNLVTALVFANQLTNVALPGTLSRLANLDLDHNRLRNFALPTGLTNLQRLTVLGNQLTNLTLPSDITKLGFLDAADNQLLGLLLPAGLRELSFLRVSGNKLATFTLPAGMTNLSAVFLRSNQLANLTLSEGLTRLVQIDVGGNQLTNLTLLPDMTQLITLGLEGNPLTTLVLAEPAAAANLPGVVSQLRNQGVSVFTYPLEAQLVRPLMLIGAFKFGITGPPGVYTVLGSTNLATWSTVGVASNPLGSVNFHDVTTNVLPQKFYRALLQVPPANMVFIPPNTFTMGTPTNEVNRHADEGPQTTVTISHGFWIGKYEVTQREYLAVTGSNPSQFPGDLDRPVETVSFPDATNYCARLTQLELAAGRIPPGSHYRLPTEAEWECAARAGTSTRFSYGDDPGFTNLVDHAWYGFNSGFRTHPVGQKAPNPWGLYDMEGNVLEWTQDWYGPYPGGSVTDPQGPASNLQGTKVIRGGAWDASEADCRSGRRLAEGVSPFITDFILGFRVVLVSEP